MKIPAFVFPLAVYILSHYPAAAGIIVEANFTRLVVPASSTTNPLEASSPSTPMGADVGDSGEGLRSSSPVSFRPGSFRSPLSQRGLVPVSNVDNDKELDESFLEDEKDYKRLVNMALIIYFIKSITRDDFKGGILACRGIGLSLELQAVCDRRRVKLIGAISSEMLEEANDKFLEEGLAVCRKSDVDKDSWKKNGPAADCPWIVGLMHDVYEYDAGGMDPSMHIAVEFARFFEDKGMFDL